MKIKLTEFSDIKEFVNLCRTFESDIDIVKGRCVLDAKSVMGVMSIDVSNGADINLHSADEDEQLRFISLFSKFRC